ncbi:MAG: aldo/keto reductase [Chloroflexota bacterium]|nr:aldo/keto reductase [Chloroflexota bacterium]
MADSLPTVQVGRTDIRVPVLGLGCAHLGGARDTLRAVDTIYYALEHGCTFFDTAPKYWKCQSELHLGAALPGVPRDSYVLSTKVGRLVRGDGALVADYSRDGVLWSLEASLKRLRLDRIDILHIHDADNHYEQALNETLPALADLRGQGVIRAIGAGMNQWEMLADFAREGDFDCFLLAGRYTLLEQRALELGRISQEQRIGLFLGGVYNSGILATGAQPGAQYNYEDAPQEVLERVSRLEAVCAHYGVALPAAALQLPLAHPGVTALVVGAESPDQVASNLEALETPIPAELWTELKQQGLLREDVPTPGAE